MVLTDCRVVDVVLFNVASSMWCLGVRIRLFSQARDLECQLLFRQPVGLLHVPYRHHRDRVFWIPASRNDKDASGPAGLGVTWIRGGGRSGNGFNGIVFGGFRSDVGWKGRSGKLLTESRRSLVEKELSFEAETSRDG